MTKYFTNNELFHIFKSNKKLLLFLLEENVIIMNEYIIKKIFTTYKYLKAKYPKYFQPEIQPFINEEWFLKCKKYILRDKLVEKLKKELPEDFYSKRKIGENDSEICKLIQNDSIEDFITYVNKNNISVNYTVKSSIYETNNFLLKNEDITLIEYSVFFGSIQIFNYLRQNGAKLKSSLWIYAVHGKNPEIIYFLEENKILPFKNIEEEEEEAKYDDDDNKNISFKQIFNESIKCHHIDVANYIRDNYLANEKENSDNTFVNSLKYYNFMFIQFDINNETSFYYLCKYDYCLLISLLCKNIDIDINKRIIFYYDFSIQFNIITFNTIQYHNF